MNPKVAGEYVQATLEENNISNEELLYLGRDDIEDLAEELEIALPALNMYVLGVKSIEAEKLYEGLGFYPDFPDFNPPDNS